MSGQTRSEGQLPERETEQGRSKPLPPILRSRCSAVACHDVGISPPLAHSAATIGWLLGSRCDVVKLFPLCHSDARLAREQVARLELNNSLWLM